MDQLSWKIIQWAALVGLVLLLLRIFFADLRKTIKSLYRLLKTISQMRQK
jgi:hypothetical protein